MIKDSEYRKRSILLSFEERKNSAHTPDTLYDGDCCSSSNTFDTRSVTNHSHDSILMQQEQEEDHIENTSRSSRSILRNPSDRSIIKQSPRVSFAESIATVHTVENLRISLTEKDRKKIWDIPPDGLSGLTAIFYEDNDDNDEELSMEARLKKMFGAIGKKNKKGRERKQQPQPQPQEQIKQQQQQQPTCKTSSFRSAISCLSIRKSRSLKKIAMLPFRSKDHTHVSDKT